jgi:serine protease Do
MTDLVTLSIFKWKTSKRVMRESAALAAVLVISGLAAKLIPITPVHAETLPHPTSFAEVVRKVKPAVIAIRVKIDADPATADDSISGETPPQRFVRRVPGDEDDRSPVPRHRIVTTSQGSGFFISADGYAVTTGHIVDDARAVEVTTDDGKTRAAKVVGNDAISDIALIKVAGDNFPFVKFSESTPRIGDWVLAVGNPFGLGGTVTAGIISACGRDIGASASDDLIQIDASVNLGNSGGPSFDMDGDVIGVNTAIVSPSGGSVGIGFAIPAETAKEVIVQLREKGVVTRGSIGVQAQPVTEDIADSLGLRGARGVLVAVPQADGPAAKAGIRPGDVITAVNGKDISDIRDLGRTITAMPRGAAAMVTVIRGGTEKTFNMTVGALQDQRKADAVLEAPVEVKRHSGANVPELGITVTSSRIRTGVVVSRVDPDGPAADRGVKDGDVILEAAGKKVATAHDLRDAIGAEQRSGRHFVLLHLKTGNRMQFVAVPNGRG